MRRDSLPSDDHGQIAAEQAVVLVNLQAPQLGRRHGREFGERSTLEEEIRVEEQKSTTAKSSTASEGTPESPADPASNSSTQS